MCTYKVCRDNKRKGFGDFWEAKRGLTGCDIYTPASQNRACRGPRMEDRGLEPKLAPKTGARTWGARHTGVVRVRMG